MSSLKEIETAIGQLTPQEYDELLQWLDHQNQLSQPIDAQLKADLDAGRIDDRLRRGLADGKAGRTQPIG